MYLRLHWSFLLGDQIVSLSPLASQILWALWFCFNHTLLLVCISLSSSGLAVETLDALHLLSTQICTPTVLIYLGFSFDWPSWGWVVTVWHVTLYSTLLTHVLSIWPCCPLQQNKTATGDFRSAIGRNLDNWEFLSKIGRVLQIMRSRKKAFMRKWDDGVMSITQMHSILWVAITGGLRVALGTAPLEVLN